MRFRIAFLATDFIWFFLFIRRFRARGLRLCGFGDHKLLSDLQFARVVDVIDGDQIAVGDFQFLCDSDWIIALLHNVRLS